MYNINMDRKSNYIQIGKRIKEARDVKGLTQGQLAEQLSTPLTPNAISLYEKGEREISVDVLTEISKITDVSFEFLATGSYGDTTDINIALRADKDLWKNQKAREQVLDFIEFIKKKTKDKK
jgi:transcriptional regulator with XRE-family HTH domain